MYDTFQVTISVGRDLRSEDPSDEEDKDADRGRDPDQHLPTLEDRRAAC